jgi:hypothetical protein
MFADQELVRFFTRVLKDELELDMRVEREDEVDFRIPYPAIRSAALRGGKSPQTG